MYHLLHVFVSSLFGGGSNQTGHALQNDAETSEFQPVNSDLRPFHEKKDDVCINSTVFKLKSGLSDLRPFHEKKDDVYMNSTVLS